MGQALAGLGRDEEAERSWDEALELAEELEQIEPRLRVAEHRVAFLESRGRFEEALAWHRSLHELNRQQVDSARSNLASTFVNAFVNAAHGRDKLVTDEQTKFIFQNKESGTFFRANSVTRMAHACCSLKAT